MSYSIYNVFAPTKKYSESDQRILLEVNSMEWAYLNRTVVNLEQERNDLQKQGLSLRAVKNILEEKYRSLSDKSGFTCPCCHNTVRMVLDIPCYFRHEREDHSRCPSLENRETYERDTQSEDKKVHRVGKEIIRTILEGQARIHGAIVKEGYFYNKRLSIVPDFIIKFPQSQKVWAIDYITGLKKDDRYTKRIMRRREIYRTYGIEPFFFLDIKWLTVHPDSDFLTLLVPAEKQLSSISPQDLKWSLLLQEIEPEIGNWYVNEAQRFSWYHPYPVHHILYLNPHDRQAHVLRYLHTNEDWNPLVIPPIKLSLEKALSLDDKQITFKDVTDDQSEDPEWFVKRLRAIHQPIADVIAYREAESKRRVEEEKARQRWLHEENERMKRATLGELYGTEQEDMNLSLQSPSSTKFEMRFTNKKQMLHVQRVLSFYNEIHVPSNKHLTQANNLVKQFLANGYLDLQNRHNLVNSMQLLSQEIIPYLKQYSSEGKEVPRFLSIPIKLDLERAVLRPNAQAAADRVEIVGLDKKRKEKLKKIFLTKIVGEAYLSSPLVEWGGLQVPLWRTVVLKYYKKYASGQITIAGILEQLQMSGIVFKQDSSLIYYPVQELLNIVEQMSLGE